MDTIRADERAGVGARPCSRGSVQVLNPGMMLAGGNGLSASERMPTTLACSTLAGLFAGEWRVGLIDRGVSDRRRLREPPWLLRSITRRSHRRTPAMTLESRRPESWKAADRLPAMEGAVKWPILRGFPVSSTGCGRPSVIYCGSRACSDEPRRSHPGRPFHGAAWQAFAECDAEMQGIPDSEATKRRAYRLYEEEKRKRS
jgi:hypothetical protein